jgi:hypothetical protein
MNSAGIKVKNLTETAMLVRLSVSQWTARRYDKKVSEKAAKDFKAEKDSGRYNKLLVAEAAIKTIQVIVNEARAYHYTNTLPWGDDDSRLLTAANYMKYTRKMSGFQSRFEKEVLAFNAAYPTLIEESKQRLGKMFKESDYPQAKDILSRFGWSIDINPLPDARDFRVSLGEGQVESIREEIERRTFKAQGVAMTDCWERLYGVVKHMATKLNEKDPIFRDTLITNIADLVELLPALNFADDSNLERMRKEVEATLCSYSPNTLREDDAVKAEAAKAAEEVMKKMAGYMGVSK